MEERKRPCRRELLNWINVVSFAADDTKLFLDTHPHHQEAQQYFDTLKKTACGIPKRICKVLRPPDPRYRRGLFGPLELDQRTVAMAGRRMLIYVEL